MPELPKTMTSAQFNEHVKTGRIPKASATGAARHRKRHVAGVMNQLEGEYCQYLELLKRAGKITDYKFECLTFNLAKRCSYKPDFLVQQPSGAIQIHEVKGYWEEKSKVKFRWAAKDWRGWYVFIAIYKAGSGWKEERF